MKRMITNPDLNPRIRRTFTERAQLRLAIKRIDKARLETRALQRKLRSERFATQRS